MPHLPTTETLPISRRDFIGAAGLAAAAAGTLRAGTALAADEGSVGATARPVGPRTNKIKIAFIGGGSQTWAPNLIRDIAFKEGLDRVQIEIALLDIHMGRAQAIHDLFQTKFREWKIVDRIKTYPTLNKEKAISGADFVLITISTGRLPAMSHDLAIPEKYSIYHTVGDTAGPGGWGRALRNIPVFQAYAKQIKKLAPNAYVLNYTNPMGVLTNVMATELGPNKVVGLCHGFFESQDFLKRIFAAKQERIRARFGGVNHFFWIMDFNVDGADGYPALWKKVKGKTFTNLLAESSVDGHGFASRSLLASELLENYRYLPFTADRHTSEFFGCYITRKDKMEQLKLVRTTIDDREKSYDAAATRIEKWSKGEPGLDKKPSRETAADMMRAIIFDETYTDVVNLVNAGQISNLPLGAVVETFGQVNAAGFTPHSVGALPAHIRALVAPHCDVQMRTMQAGLASDREGALMALAGDPACAHLTVTEIKQMGRELMEAHRPFLPDFFRG